MSSTKQILTPDMQTCLCQIVKVSAIDDTKKDRKIRKKICKANDVNYKEFEINIILFKIILISSSRFNPISIT